MRRVKVAALQPGMRLGISVYGSRGLLLREGVELGPAHIEHLQRARLEAVYIDDPLFADIPVPPDVSWEVKSSLLAACSALWEHFRTVGKGMAESVGGVAGSVGGARGAGPGSLAGGVGGARAAGAGGRSGEGAGGVGAVRWPVPYESLMEAASALEDELRQVPAWAVQMVGAAEEDGVVAHAVNTALVAASLAAQAGLGGYVRELAVAGLLHDAGLALLPARLHSEPDAVEGGDRPLLESHPLLGVRLMRSQPASAYVQAAVAQHHERLDGSGYPQRLSGARLAVHAQLVAVADTFTRMVQAGASRSESWEYVVSGAGTEFDHRLVQAFSQVIPPHALGSTVRLSTGEEGVVVALETGLLTRPRVRLLRDAAGRPVTEPVTYDLADPAHRNRVIVSDIEEA